MNSLFKIEQSLIHLGNLIESENEFEESSDELKIIEEQLKIKKEELVTKVGGYLQIISQAEAQAEMGVREINRVKLFIDRKLHKAERMKGSLLEALLLFGEEDKKGIKRLEIGTNRLSTRRSKSTEITNEELVTDDAKLCDITFKNLTIEMKNFLARRLQDLPESEGKSVLVGAFSPEIKISKTLIKEKLKTEELDWANEKTTYYLTIK